MPLHPCSICLYTASDSPVDACRLSPLGRCTLPRPTSFIQLLPQLAALLCSPARASFLPGSPSRITLSPPPQPNTLPTTPYHCHITPLRRRRRPPRRPLPPQHRPPEHPPHQVPPIQPTQNRHRPPLPIPIPIQRNRHRAQPRAHEPPYAPAKRLVHRRVERADGRPRRAVDAVHVKQRKQREHGEVRGAERRVRDERVGRGAEADEGEVEEGDDEGGEEEGEEGGLRRLLAHTVLHFIACRIVERYVP